MAAATGDFKALQPFWHRLNGNEGDLIVNQHADVSLKEKTPVSWSVYNGQYNTGKSLCGTYTLLLKLLTNRNTLANGCKEVT